METPQTVKILGRFIVADPKVCHGRLDRVMNILDENIIASQRQRLRSWRIPVRQIGVDIARKGLQDKEGFTCKASCGR